jgi:4-hydroxy-tetrahydrodipicolinate synthase
MNRLREGVYIALVTPFNEDESIDFRSLEKLLNHMNKNGVDGLFVNGTTAEFPHLNFTERIDLAKFIAKRFNGSIIVNVSDTSTDKVLKNIKCLKKINEISAVSSLIPHFYELNQSQILNFYTEIIRNSYFPVFVYNNPGITNRIIENETMKEILKFKNMIGIKDSSKDFDWYKSIRSYINGKIYLSGGDGEILNYLKNGSIGTVSTIGNVIPGTVKKLYDSYKANDFEEAEILQKHIKAIRRISKNYSNVSGIKGLLECIGFTKKYMRAPLTSISRKNINNLKEKIEKKLIQEIIDDSL